MRTVYVCQEIRTWNAYEAVQAGELRNQPVYMDVYTGDPVTSGRHIYRDGGWEWIGPAPERPWQKSPTESGVPPECAEDCKWRSIFSHDRQRNALRMELASMVDKRRCGWKLKPAALGGRPLDYESCTFSAQAQEVAQ